MTRGITSAKVAVIIPAAGAGKRFGDRQNKIFQPLAGRPIFMRTLDIFAGLEDICQIQLVTSADDIKTLKRDFDNDLRNMNVELTEGGPTRSCSVRNALARLPQQARLVCVHDAVRPCVCRERVAAVIARADQTGAAILTWPLHGTLKRVGHDGVIIETVPRDSLHEAQTPQVFRRDIIEAAYAANTDATDDAHLVQAIGLPVSVVPGDPRNIKITTPADLALAQAVWPTIGQI